ncbi:hypothetical protein GCM10010307_19380 [Streptomyces vastus]|uniref:Uncharacterized protein n=1 Tax=Streptomyces vastus TaxID=285451 RepID=A0ABP6CVV0_9ACTN
MRSERSLEAEPRRRDHAKLFSMYYTAGAHSAAGSLLTGRPAAEPQIGTAPRPWRGAGHPDASK